MLTRDVKLQPTKIFMLLLLLLHPFNGLFSRTTSFANHMPHRCRQITTPVVYHSVFTGWMPFLNFSLNNLKIRISETTLWILFRLIHVLCMYMLHDGQIKRYVEVAPVSVWHHFGRSRLTANTLKTPWPIWVGVLQIFSCLLTHYRLLWWRHTDVRVCVYRSTEAGNR